VRLTVGDLKGYSTGNVISIPNLPPVDKHSQESVTPESSNTSLYQVTHLGKLNLWDLELFRSVRFLVS